jgi:predicted dehydrogenase
MIKREKINVAVAGLGWVATNRHIPIILQKSKLHLYGIVDKRAERLQAISQKYPWLQTSLSRTGEMPWADNIQAVLIATDPMNHFELAKKILISGKHVLMEKPLTMSPEEGRELIQICNHSGVSLCVVHNFQFARSTLKLKKMIADGDLGEIQSIEATQFSNPRRRLPVWYEQLPFGLFYDETPHMLYILEALAGKNIHYLTSTVVKKAGQNTPVSVTGYYNASGVPIRLNMNFEAALSEWHVIVMGTKKIGIVDIFRDILVTLPNDGLHRAREILTSSGSVIATHLSGFLASGAFLARKKLFYGADIVWDKFIGQISVGETASEISANCGLQIVEMQHELMHKSKIIDLPA